jgi:hypothetical protein
MCNWAAPPPPKCPGCACPPLCTSQQYVQDNSMCESAVCANPPTHPLKQYVQNLLYVQYVQVMSMCTPPTPTVVWARLFVCTVCTGHEYVQTTHPPSATVVCASRPVCTYVHIRQRYVQAHPPTHACPKSSK